MPSGGARARSGPAPDPMALRRDRTDDAGWIVLPAAGYQGDVPEFPLPKNLIYDVYRVDGERIRELDHEATDAAREAEVALWTELWAKPQASQWAELGLKYEVAAYVRAYLESNAADAPAALKTAALRMSAEIGLSLPGMHSLRWKFAPSVVEPAQTAPARRASSSRGRLKAVPNADTGK